MDYTTKELLKRYAKLAEPEATSPAPPSFLGMDRSHLYRRMRALGINHRDARPGAS